ncbi:unnamed protein product [Rotaria sordida]|uniref:Uncharacterized protein n=2 Tax=Rotaria sordida TaxID=392033 RepID=A0A819NUF1_9BILA|nr:unnamed protein product [Rotaria sordida]CAF4002161.1 unnamed protein product [Rotaria sordida]
MTIESNQVTNSRNHAILDRFCMKILPRIHDKVESLTLQACFLPCVLRATSYLQLRKLVIINLKFTMALYIFNDGSDTYALSRSLLTGLPSTTCCSSSIVHLRIKMQNIDDCLYLLDGRLSQLHTLIITLYYIHDPVQIRLRSQKIIRHSLKIMNNMTNPLRLKCFSIHAYHRTTEFDSLVIPLLRRMVHLEKLTLSLRVGGKNSFIDGTYLNNYILSQMPRLHTFHFDIVTEYIRINEQQPKPTSDDIRRTFTERGYHVDCYIDYDFYNLGRCHIYSCSFDMERRFPSIRT